MSDSLVMSTVDLVAYQDGGIVSRQIVKKTAGNITAFAFDAGQELTEHTSPFEALLEVIDGVATIQIAGQPYRVSHGEMILLPAGVPHAVRAETRFKMLLTMIRS